MGKFKVVITDHEYETIDNEKRILGAIDADIVDCQVRDAESVIAAAKDADAVIFQYADMNADVIAALKNCKVIAKYASGVDGIDIPACTANGIYFCNVMNYCTDEVSDHAMALITAAGRRLFTYANYVADGNWYGKPQKINSLRHQVVGLIGFGRIAREVAIKLKPSCDQIWAYDAYCDPKVMAELGVECKTLDEVLSGSDIISIHCPLTDETHHMFNKAAFEKMKPNAVVVNVGRGGIVDAADMAWALDKGLISGAMLDVLEGEPPVNNPLMGRKNVIVTPHTAWYSVESEIKLQSIPAEQIAHVLSTGEPPVNLVNPDVRKVLGK
ncbi:MAG: C-terminal binding protein [Oscillospiraceae bacterium]|nr:C-terminal binding protein [Oscillospiraceae bacterium]